MASAFKIAIVGSGPAGLSAAGRAAQLGLSHVLLEKTDHLSDTIYKYQKGKHVMATPSQLVLRSDFDFDAGKREAILGVWDRQAEERKINVQRNADVKAITGQKGDFTLTLTNGQQVQAEYVILGIGTAPSNVRPRTAGIADMGGILSPWRRRRPGRGRGSPRGSCARNGTSGSRRSSSCATRCSARDSSPECR